MYLQLVRVPNLYFGSRLGAQYPKNSKIFLWLLPQPTLGNALVEVDKNWNISGLLSGFQLEKLFFIHTVRSYSHSTATPDSTTPDSTNPDSTTPDTTTPGSTTPNS